jgi:hypothetical protein
MAEDVPRLPITTGVTVHQVIPEGYAMSGWLHVPLLLNLEVSWVFFKITGASLFQTYFSFCVCLNPV